MADLPLFEVYIFFVCSICICLGMYIYTYTFIYVYLYIHTVFLKLQHISQYVYPLVFGL